MIDTPKPVRAYDNDAHGQGHTGLSEGALIVMAQEVIVRLSRWAQDSGRARTPLAPVRQPPDIDALCDALLGQEPAVARHIILDAHAQGASHEELCLFYIAAAAKRLGEMWEEDTISFRDVSVAGGRMLHLLRDLRDLAPPVTPRSDRSALFASVPGEQHILGVTMAADMFRERQWDIDLRIGQSEAQLAQLVRSGGYPIVGLSATSVERVRALTRVVVELRLAAPKLLIFVGGYIAKVEPEIAVRVGADGAGWDMDQCHEEMKRLSRLIPEIYAS
ncbi:cobalamin B12-binding domain-containing protein [Aestuariicoccus sp. MJ-SS9]|uniref:cobalamin B12-binding domain-containing protein n=1 Tax=Aestuariicoccus sp. MJ-SS9 TaxID=3079855 RepID=UPI00290EAEDE|nr:cobalamin B12-binding domain-containing protein [Aestuariicoccus sp. MJ-SS9]MDU8910767.1 cobalamin B12-binding domain-containing protein [Aestuariicoccus sp. MJ-SS9]